MNTLIGITSAITEGLPVAIGLHENLHALMQQSITPMQPERPRGRPPLYVEVPTALSLLMAQQIREDEITDPELAESLDWLDDTIQREGPEPEYTEEDVDDAEEAIRQASEDALAEMRMENRVEEMRIHDGIAPANRWQPQSLSEVIPYVKSNPGRSVAQIARALDLKPGSVSSHLFKECDAGRMVRFRGKGTRCGYGYYYINEATRRLIEQGGVPDEPETPSASLRTHWERLMGDED